MRTLAPRNTGSRPSRRTAARSRRGWSWDCGRSLMGIRPDAGRMRVRLVATAAIIALGVCRGAHAQTIEEGQAKAMFLFNFARFVHWPEGMSTIVIGVVGDDSLAETTEGMLRGRAIDGRTVVVRRLRHADDPAGAHVLYVASSRQREDAEMLQRTRAGVLTVGDTVQFLRDGGMIRIFVESRRVRFQVNAPALSASGVTVHSQLLSLTAQSFKGRRRPGSLT